MLRNDLYCFNLGLRGIISIYNRKGRGGGTNVTPNAIGRY